jgi:hypothetical protein
VTIFSGFLTEKSVKNIDKQVTLPSFKVSNSNESQVSKNHSIDSVLLNAPSSVHKGSNHKFCQQKVVRSAFDYFPFSLFDCMSACVRSFVFCNNCAQSARDEYGQIDRETKIVLL